MRNKILFIALTFFLSPGCSSTKIVSYKIFDKNEKKVTYQIRIPKGFTTTETVYESERFKVFLYPDSSKLFFSNKVALYAFYPDAYKKYGKDLNLKLLSADTLTINGVDESGRIWKDRKATNVVYGYIQVPPEKKGIFDSIINRVIIK